MDHETKIQPISETPGMKPPEDDKESEITDVTLFFRKITEAYINFTQDVVSLTDKIPTYSPQRISNECKKLGTARDKLTVMDQQMIHIIQLAASEIAEDPMVDDYRVAFAKTMIACSTLHEKLQEFKITLQEEDRL